MAIRKIFFRRRRRQNLFSNPLKNPGAMPLNPLSFPLPRAIPWLVLLLFLSNPLEAQVDTLHPEQLPDLIEDLLGQSPEEFDYADAFEQTARLREKPLLLNEAGEIELRELGLLSESQIQQFLAYRARAGALLSLYELQAIPGFTLSTIRLLLPFVQVQGSLDDVQASIGEMLRNGRNEAQLRWGRFLEPQQGYAHSSTGKGYLGDPNQLFIRFRHTYYNRLSLGVVGDKDRGEPFRWGHGQAGFSFYSAHFFLNQYNSWLRALAIGDYRLAVGQGLLAIPGFGYGKSAFATAIKRGAPPLRAHASAGESGFLRGTAATFAISNRMTITPFASWRRRDGNLVEADSLAPGSDTSTGWTSSISEAGLHRTAEEIARKGILKHLVAGILLQYHRDDLQVGINVLSNTLRPGFYPNPRLYNRYFFRGSQLFNTSIDYTFRLGGAHFFGETAYSNNGAIATVNGVLFSPASSVDFAVLWRHFPRHYQAISAAPFADGSGARNESGVYLGIELRPAAGFSIHAYSDFWVHPWLRYSADRPTRGEEYRLRLTYEKRRGVRTYLELRSRRTEENTRAFPALFNQPSMEQTLFARFHLSYPIGKNIEFRSRIDWGMAETQAAGKQYGAMLLQDILFRPMQSPFSFTARFALYGTPGYDIRFYHYENDLLNTFSIPPYFGYGSRFYVNIRLRARPGLTLECRLAQTYRHDGGVIGSGLESFPGNRRTQIASQIKWIF
jgi:hypothetical protein